MMSKKRWTPGDTILLCAFAAVPLVLLALVARLSRPAPVAVVVPTPVLPSPNAFDTFVAAGRAPNARALALVRRGLTQPFVSPPVRSFFDHSPGYAKFRGLARLLAQDSAEKAGRENWSGAAQSGLDAVALGGKIPRGSGLLGMLVGSGCQTIGRKAVAPTVGHLDAQACRAAAGRLESITASHVAFTATLTEEKWQTQASLQQLFRRPHWRGTLLEILCGDTFGKGFGLNGRDQARLLLTSDDAIMSHYTRWMDAKIADAGRPWPPSNVALPSDPLSRALADFEIPRPRLRDMDGSRTQNPLLMLTLALRAYRLEHGNYPETLAQLTPGYLKAVPADPFAASGPMRYKRRGANYVLYSLGPDGKDDGGRAIDNPSVTTRARRFVEPDSRGDIVPGVNP